MFNPLTKSEIKDIVELQFDLVSKRLAENNITLNATAAAFDALAEMGFDPQFGARPLKRVIQKNVLNELSKMILAGKINRESIIELDYKNFQFEFRNK